MDSPHSDPCLLISRLQHAVWHGDWNDAAQLAGVLANDHPAPHPEALTRRLQALDQVLNSARAGRSGMHAALARIKVISGFSV